MIDETLRQHYRRLFNIKPTIDNSRPKFFLQNRRRISTRPASAINLRKDRARESTEFNRQYVSNDQLNYSLGNTDCDGRIPKTTSASDNNVAFLDDYPETPRAVHVSVNNSNYGQNRNLSSSSNHVDFIKVQRSHQMSLSDKIDSFLQEVTEQEAKSLHLQEVRQERRSVRGNFISQRSISYQSSFESRPSSIRNSIKRIESKETKTEHRSTTRPHSALSVQPKNKNFLKANIKKTKSRPTSAVIPRGSRVENVESRLKYNRNYQGPVKKKTIIKIKEPAYEPVDCERKVEYEADFESDEYGDNLNRDDEKYAVNDENEEDEAALQRQAWLMEQAERGRARQRALMSRLSNDIHCNEETVLDQRISQEKESSRDSAYGYSADSRMPTREPTPDNRMLTVSHAQQTKRLLLNLKNKKEAKNFQSKSKEEVKTEDASHKKKLHQINFLRDVTNDIITRGIYSERGLRNAITGQSKKKEYEISSLEMENLLRQLKLELGIEGSNNMTRSETDIIGCLGVNCKPTYPPAPPNRKTLKEIRECTQKVRNKKILDDLDERQIKDILKDASMDSETVNSIIGLLADDKKETVSEDSTDSPKLFHNFNISSFNVSFNAGRGAHTNDNGNLKKTSVDQKSKAVENTRSKSTKEDSSVPKKDLVTTSSKDSKKESPTAPSSMTRSSSLCKPETGDIVTKKDKEENIKKPTTNNDDCDITYSIDENVYDNSDGTDCDYSSDSDSEIEEEIKD